MRINEFLRVVKITDGDSAVESMHFEYAYSRMLKLRNSLDRLRQPLQRTFPCFPPLSYSVCRNVGSDNHVISFSIYMEVINTGTVLLRHFHCISICSPDVNRVAYEKGGFHLTRWIIVTRLQLNQSGEPGQLSRWTTEELWFDSQ